MTLPDYIDQHMESLLDEWESFARNARPARADLDRQELRNWARSLLEAMAAEMRSAQTGREQERKSKGERPEYAPRLTDAAQTHAMDRLAHGFNIDQIVSEYRALRATVVRLWTRNTTTDDEAVDELVRFNEAMDQALTESIHRYSAALERARDLFIGALSHDMRTPLGSILVSAEALLCSEVLDSRHLQGAVRIRNAGKRISRMLQDLLDFTQTRVGGKLPMHREQTDLSSVCTAIVEEIRALHPDREIQLECRTSLDGMFDVNRVGQMLSNLLLNAVKYGDEGAPVRVTAHSTDDDVFLCVHNEGEPIPKELQRCIFEPLVRGIRQNEAENDRGGLGLGLYIASEIAQGHDGYIDLESTAVDGTTFKARLSRRIAKGRRSNDPAAPEPDDRKNIG